MVGATCDVHDGFRFFVHMTGFCLISGRVLLSGYGSYFVHIVHILDGGVL